jgi:hypothetical protein
VMQADLRVGQVLQLHVFLEDHEWGIHVMGLVLWESILTDIKILPMDTMRSIRMIFDIEMWLSEIVRCTQTIMELIIQQ